MLQTYYVLYGLMHDDTIPVFMVLCMTTLYLSSTESELWKTCL